MADFNNPTLATAYTTFLTEIKGRDVDALTLQKDAATNSPNGALKVVAVGGSRPSEPHVKLQEYNVSAYEDRLLDISGGGTGASTAATARSNLGIGTMGVQASDSIAVTGGTISGVTISGTGTGLTALNPANLTGGTGIVSISHGGTGASAKADAFDALSPTTTKGDLIVSNGTDNVRLPVTAYQGYGLVSDSSQSSGLAWSNLMPVSSIILFAGAQGPEGFLMCSGAAVSRTTFANLFAAIGTIYGAGDGSTTFNVPNLIYRFPVGSHVTNLPIGSTGGSWDHAHSGPSHTHTSDDHYHVYDTPSKGVLDIVSGATSSSKIGLSSGDDGKFAWRRNNDALTGVNTDTTVSTLAGFGAASHVHPQGTTGWNPASRVTSADGTGATGTANPPYLSLYFFIKY